MNRDASQRIVVTETKAVLHMSALSPTPPLPSQTVGLELAAPAPSPKLKPNTVIITPLAA